MFDPVLLARLQFGVTASFHIIFPCLIIGLAFYLAMVEALWLKTKRETYRVQYRFWVKPFTVACVIGMISGLVLSFQLDTVFEDFYYKTAEILVPIRRVELANAVLLEAGALGVMRWGWQRVGNRLHFLATLMMVVGVLISGVCILARNSWMQTPDGFVFVDGNFALSDWLDAIISPSFPYRFAHMLGAAFVSTAFFILGISAWFLLKRRHVAFAQYSLRVSLLAIVVLAPMQLLSGDLHGLNTAEHQPVKLAAIEGLWDTTAGAPLVLFGLPDNAAERNHHAVEIPRLASLIITHDTNGVIRGLKEVPKDERPNVPLVFFSFRVMVAVGLLMLVVGIVGWMLMRKQRLYQNRRFLRVCCLMTPSGLIATIAGWCVSEAGRQPWVVSGLLRTAEVTTPLRESSAGDFLGFVGTAYIVLFLVFVSTLRRFVRNGPDEKHETASAGSGFAVRATRRFTRSAHESFQLLLDKAAASTVVRPIQPHPFGRKLTNAVAMFLVGVVVGGIGVSYYPSENSTTPNASVLTARQSGPSEPRWGPMTTAVASERTDRYHKQLALARDYANLGSLYLTRRELERAETMYRASLSSYESISELPGVADSYTNLGTVYWTRHDLDQAETMYRKALEINRQLGRKEKQAHAFGNLGVVYQSRGELGRAREHHYRALRIYEGLEGNIDAVANVYSNLGRLHKSQGNLARAEVLFRKAVTMRRNQESDIAPPTDEFKTDDGKSLNAEFKTASLVHGEAAGAKAEKRGDFLADGQ